MTRRVILAALIWALALAPVSADLMLVGAGGLDSPVIASISFAGGAVSGVGCASLSACIADTRSTTATSVTPSGGIATAAANTPRIDCTNATCGLLNEGASTNLLAGSVGGPTSPWTLNGTLTVAQTTPAPDGSYAYSWNNTGADQGYYQYKTLAANTQYTISQYVYAVSGSNPVANFGCVTGMWGGGSNTYTATAEFNLSTLTFISADAGISSKGYVALGGGFYRIWIVATTNSTGGSCGFTDYNYSTTPQIAHWGYDVEASAFPTSYTPTTTASVTRAADGISATGLLATALAAGQAYVDMIDQATGTTSRTLYAAAAFNWPLWKWVTRICVYNSGVSAGYLTAHSTYGTGC